MTAAAVTQQPQQSRREAIVRAAESVFAEAGYDRARLEDVAQRVGIRRASLLYHFRDKATLYAAVLDSLFGDLQQRCRRVLDGNGSTGLRLERTVDAWLDFVAERPCIIPIMLRELADGVRDTARPYAERAERVVVALSQVIDAGQAERALRQTDGVQVLMVLAGASAFLTLGGVLIATEGPPAIADRRQQRALLLTLFRKLLGTRGPRSIARDASETSEVSP